MSVSGLLGARIAGLLAGLGLVAILAVQAWVVPGATGPAAASVDLRAVPTGEVGVEPEGPVLDRSAVVPGGPAVRGTLRLMNRTAGPRLVRARVAGGDPELARVLVVTLTARGRVVFRGPLERLESAIALPRGGSADVDVAVRIPRDGAREAVARAGTWTLTFEGGR